DLASRSSRTAVNCLPAESKLAAPQPRSRTTAPGGRARKSSCIDFLLRPGRDDAVHPRIRHQLTHVLVGMHDDPQIYAVHVGVNALDFDFAPEVGGLGRGVSDSYGIERAL